MSLIEYFIFESLDGMSAGPQLRTIETDLDQLWRNQETEGM